MSMCVRKPTVWVPTRSNTNRAVQSQKTIRGWKFFWNDQDGRHAHIWKYYKSLTVCESHTNPAFLFFFFFFFHSFFLLFKFDAPFKLMCHRHGGLHERLTYILKYREWTLSVSRHKRKETIPHYENLHMDTIYKDILAVKT